MNNKTTLADVAKVAGVSQSTISHFLNGNFKKMSPITKDRIEKAVYETGYTVNPIAKSLITGKMNTIGLIWSNSSHDYLFEDLYMMAFAKVIKAHLKKEGYRLILLDQDELLSNIKVVDGIILKATIETEELLSKMQSSRFPMVTLGRCNINYGVQVVRVDDYSCGKLGIEYLMSQGYRDILILTYPNGVVPGFDDRLNGASQALQKNFSIPKVLQGDMTREFGYSVVCNFYKLGKLPQAMFCLNDESAIGVLDAVKKLGIPDGLGVLGVDDMPTVSEFLGLTTFKHPIDKLGEMVCKSIIEQIENPQNPISDDIVLPTTLIERKSCKKIGM